MGGLIRPASIPITLVLLPLLRSFPYEELLYFSRGGSNQGWLIVFFFSEQLYPKQKTPSLRNKIETKETKET